MLQTFPLNRMPGAPFLWSGPDIMFSAIQQYQVLSLPTFWDPRGLAQQLVRELEGYAGHRILNP